MTFACGVAIAGLHVVNRRFIAPMYDVVLNLAAFLAAVASSVLLGHVLPAVFAALAVLAWLILACLLYTSPSPRDRTRSRMPSSA